jgi:DedD protein
VLDESTSQSEAITEPAPVAQPVVIKAPPVEVVEKMQQRALDEVSPAEDMPRLDENGIPAAWSLQLASFKDERNAKSLRADLTKAGYKVYIRRANDLVRVYIGPEMQRTRLESLKESIKEQYSLDGMIVRFTTQ